MGLISRMRTQTAVYWGPTGQIDRNGNPVLDDPIELPCRWEDVNELFLNSEGEQEVSNAKVYVDRVLQLEGWLKKGELDDLASTNVYDNDDVYVIRRFDQLPKLKSPGIPLASETPDILLTAIL